MDDTSYNHFDASVSTTSKSPVKTSTVAKGSIKWNDYALFKRNMYGSASDSLFSIDAHSPIAVLNEVTNTQKGFETKPIFRLNNTSFASEGANSSLGILHVENFSDMDDSLCESLSVKRKIFDVEKCPEKVSEYKDSSLQSEFTKVTEEDLSEEKNNAHDCSSSSSDIEYDGTNIPELNMDFDVASLINAKTDDTSNSNVVSNQSKLSDTHLSKSEEWQPEKNTKSELFESDISTESSNSARQSIFENFQSSYDSLIKKITPGSDKNKSKDKNLPTIKVCPFLGVSSFEIEPILQKEGQINVSSSIEKPRGHESLSVDFCPELISARSSSFKSSMVSQNMESEASSTDSNTLQLSGPSTMQEYPGDLENEVLSGSCFLSSVSKMDSKVSFGNADMHSNTYDCDKQVDDLFLKTDLTQGDIPDVAEEEDWCRRLGISESEFLGSDAAKELLKKDSEAYEKANMFVLNQCDSSSKVNASEWSPPSRLEVTAPSWISSEDQDSSRHISLGAFIKAHSEQLGTLSENSDRERPYFGTTVSTPTKSSPPSMNDGKASDLKNAFGAFRSSVLSDILDSISFSDPLNFAAENMDVFSSVLQKFPQNKKTIAADTQELLNETKICIQPQSELASKAISETEELETLNSNDTVTEQVDSDLVQNDLKETNAERNEQTENSMNISSVGSSCDTASIKTAKLDVCSNCSMSASEQNVAQGYSRPTSACSSSCSNAVAIENPYTVQYGCMKHVNIVQDHGRCMIPNNYLVLPRTSSGVCSHVCPQIGIPPDQVSTQNVFPVRPSIGSQSSIQAPPRLCFPEKIALGDAQEINLTIQNAANIAYNYHISCISVYLNRLPISLEMCGLSFTKTVPSTVGSTTDIKLILAPKYEGKYEIDLQVDAMPSSGGHSLGVIPGLTTQTKVEYDALQPSISLKRKSEENLNLASVVAGSTFVEYVTLINNCEVSVPLRISLTSDSIQNQVYFGLKDVNRQNKTNAGRPTFLSPKIMLYRLPGTKNESYPSHFDIPIVFESIRTQVCATITAAIETPTLSTELAFIRVSVTAGVAKLVLKDPSQNPLRLKTSEASTCSHSLTVVNDGTIPVIYDLQIESESNCFSVSPNSVSLEPKQSATISVTYTPLISQSVKGVLLAAAEPHGQVFTIIEIYGEIKSHMYSSFPKNPRTVISQPTRDSIDSAYDSSNLIECNKKSLIWGGTDIGKSVLKSFSVRNPRREVVQAKLFIKDKCPAFQIIGDTGSKTFSSYITLKPREDKEISVAFTPSAVASYSSVLFVKSVEGKESTTHSIPMCGYGGASKVEILGLPGSEGLIVDLCSNMETVYKNIILQNVGYRAAFVKLHVTYGGIVQNPVERQTVINPSEFVLLENEKKNIHISISCVNKSYTSSDEIITILYGDEILRQRLRKKAKSMSSDPSCNSYNIDFTCPYSGENRVPQDSCVFSARNDALFFTSIKKLMLPIFFSSENANFSTHDFTALSVVQDSFANLTLNSTMFSSSYRRLTIEGHSPPVKESAIRNVNRLSLPIPFEDNLSKTDCASSSVSNTVDKLNSLKLESWTLSPKTLTLDSESKDNRILLKSHSNFDMRFKAECTIDVITVSPVSGNLAANGEIGLRLTLINRNHIKLCEDYQGKVKVFCDGTEKIVHVKVMRDETKAKRFLQQLDVNQLHVPSQSTMSLSMRSGFLGDSTLDCTVLEHPILHIDIYNFPKIIDLQITKVGCSNDLKLNVDNISEKAVTWNIHPNSILFTEPFDDSIDSSPAIEFSITNGVIRTKDSIAIVVRFSPPSVAQFSQFFELSLAAENGMKEITNFKVMGKSVSDYFHDADCRSDESKNKISSNVKKKTKSEVFAEKEICEFRTVAPGQKSTADIKIKNISSQVYKFTIIKPLPPFVLKHSSVTIKPHKFTKIPVTFRPAKVASNYEGEVKFLSENGVELKVKLKGCCLA